MALPNRCTNCDGGELVYLRNGVPVDTSDGTVELAALTDCSQLAGCSIVNIGDVPPLPETPNLSLVYYLEWDPNTATFDWIGYTP